MSDYVKNSISKDEKVVQTAQISFWAILPKILGIVLVIGLFFLFRHLMEDVLPSRWFEDGAGEGCISSGGLLKTLFFLLFLCVFFMLVHGIFELLSFEVVVTNKRIIGKKGFFSVRAINIPIDQVSNAEISLSFFGRIFKYATIEVSSTGMKMIKGNTQVVKLTAIKNSYDFLNSINSAIDDKAEEDRKRQAEEIARAMQGKTE